MEQPENQMNSPNKALQVTAHKAPNLNADVRGKDMKTEKALRNLRLTIVTPIYLGVLFLGLDFLSQNSDTLPDFNRLFSIMSPMQTAGGLLLVVGINTYAYFAAYRRSLGEKQ